MRVEDNGLFASHFASYGTSISHETFTTGLHYVQALVTFRSHYCGIGVVACDGKALPSAGTGAWLGRGAVQWVTGSGLWSYSSHRANVAPAYTTGDEVGVLLDLRGEHRGSVHWYLAGTCVGSLELEPCAEGFAFCFCVGDGGVRITATEVPKRLPPSVAPP